MPGLLGWPPYPHHQRILIGDSPPPSFRGGREEQQHQGRTPLAVLSSLSGLRRGYLHRARLVHGKTNPNGVGWSSEWGQETLFISRYCLVNIRCQHQNFTLTGWGGSYPAKVSAPTALSYCLLCCIYLHPLFISLLPSQTLLPVTSAPHYPALSILKGWLSTSK